MFWGERSAADDSRLEMKTCSQLELTTSPAHKHTHLVKALLTPALLNSPSILIYINTLGDSCPNYCGQLDLFNSHTDTNTHQNVQNLTKTAPSVLDNAQELLPLDLASSVLDVSICNNRRQVFFPSVAHYFSRRCNQARWTGSFA